MELNFFCFEGCVCCGFFFFLSKKRHNRSFLLDGVSKGALPVFTQPRGIFYPKALPPSPPPPPPLITCTTPSEFIDWKALPVWQACRSRCPPYPYNNKRATLSCPAEPRGEKRQSGPVDISNQDNQSEPNLKHQAPHLNLAAITPQHDDI